MKLDHRQGIFRPARMRIVLSLYVDEWKKSSKKSTLFCINTGKAKIIKSESRFVSSSSNNAITSGEGSTSLSWVALTRVTWLWFRPRICKADASVYCRSYICIISSGPEHCLADHLVIMRILSFLTDSGEGRDARGGEERKNSILLIQNQ